MPVKKSATDDETFHFPNRLYRSETNKMLGGVAGGIGEFFTIDPTLIRLFFVLISMFGGAGIFLYLVLWAIVPTKNNLSPNNIHENVAEMKTKAESLASQLKTGQTSANRRIWSILLIGLGAFLLIRSFANVDMGQIWPVLLIIVGLLIIFRK